MPEKLIPGIREKIDKKIRELKLKPLITPQEFIAKAKGEKHRYSSVCQDKNGKLVVFYARLHQNEDAKEKVTKEVLFGKKLKSEEFRKHLPFSNFLPKYFKGNIENDFEWFTREYIKDKPLGINEKLTKRIDRKEIELISLAAYQISETDISLMQDMHLPISSVRDYIQTLSHLEKSQNKELLENKNYIQQLSRLIEQTHTLLKKENKYLSHGDFNLGNIIETEKKLKIIDWESMKINNFAFDIAYLFMHLWEGERKLRKDLIEKYMSLLPQSKRENFRILFQIVVAYLAIGGINVKPREIEVKRLKKRKKFFLAALKMAPFGFDALINI